MSPKSDPLESPAPARGPSGSIRAGTDGKWIEHADESSELALGPVLRAGEHFNEIGLGEVRTHHEEAREVELT
jgi:hypothetical protein